MRKYSSADTLYKVPEVNIPTYWIRPQDLLSCKAGAHRFLWDMHYQPLNTPVSYSMSAIYEDTPPAATSPWVLPGTYTVKLIVMERKYEGERLLHNGKRSPMGERIEKEYTGSLEVVMDPRIKTSKKDLQLQHDLSYLCYKDLDEIIKTKYAANKLLDDLKESKKAATAKEIKQIEATISRISELLSGMEGFGKVTNELWSVFGILQGGDMKPTSQCIQAADEVHNKFRMLMERWKSLKGVVTK